MDKSSVLRWGVEEGLLLYGEHVRHDQGQSRGRTGEMQGLGSKGTGLMEGGPCVHANSHFFTPVPIVPLWFSSSPVDMTLWILLLMLLESSNRVWEALSYGLFDIKNKRVPWNAPPPILKSKPRLCSHDGSKEYLLACLEDVSIVPMSITCKTRPARDGPHQRGNVVSSTWKWPLFTECPVLSVSRKEPIPSCS